MIAGQSPPIALGARNFGLGSVSSVAYARTAISLTAVRAACGCGTSPPTNQWSSRSPDRKGSVDSVAFSQDQASHRSEQATVIKPEREPLGPVT